MKAKLILLLALVLIGTSCDKGQSSFIEESLNAHFLIFEEEAAFRGLALDMDDLDISGYVEDIEERGTLGQCLTYASGSKSVVIDEAFWNRASDYEREYIVFHELGHCLLEREHTNVKDEEGNCTSIMQDGSGICMGHYNAENREHLLEELFN